MVIRTDMIPAPEKSNITGIVLAGGQGRRMGGADKGWITVRGRPMIEHVVARLKPQVGPLVISANRNIERYATLRIPVVTDTYTGYLGPLAGIVSGMQAATTPYVVTAPCDSPLLSRSLVARLAAALSREAVAVAVAHDGTRVQPVFLLVHRDLQEDLKAYLDSGGRGVEGWIDRHPTACADFADTPQAFSNINDWNQRERAERAPDEVREP